jgi:Rrf2 family nitric oxide-sensitive transcriptional repressor
MLQISKATDYALLFLTNLAKQPGRKWSVREAAEELGISRRFLANIIHQLARKGVIVTSKGAGGGVTLQRTPGSLTIGEIVTVFEGEVNLISCAAEDTGCEREENCSMRTFWMTLSKDIENTMYGTTIERLGDTG